MENLGTAQKTLPALKFRPIELPSLQSQIVPTAQSNTTQREGQVEGATGTPQHPSPPTIEGQATPVRLLDLNVSQKQNKYDPPALQPFVAASRPALPDLAVANSTTTSGNTALPAQKQATSQSHSLSLPSLPVAVPRVVSDKQEQDTVPAAKRAPVELPHLKASTSSATPEVVTNTFSLPKLEAPSSSNAPAPSDTTVRKAARSVADGESSTSQTPTYSIRRLPALTVSDLY